MTEDSKPIKGAHTLALDVHRVGYANASQGYADVTECCASLGHDDGALPTYLKQQ